MNEAKPQDGSKVQGYKKLSDGDIGNMNKLKGISRQFIAQLDTLSVDNSVDHRWLSIAKTEMQKACMSACRAVAKPDDDC
ncbi:hypothetical protein GKR67_02225 [Providencia alcalifaciens]|uniref:Acb2/Tad1 hairpin domain-containing protein n=1 Tax=Providencia alcalifaciens TaxID=126385 RepID=A0AAW9V729_9GAMM|nr:hypothetical protein [Providencia alcalifaciens]